MRKDFRMAAHANVLAPEVVFELAVHTLGGGTLVVANVFGGFEIEPVLGLVFAFDVRRKFGIAARIDVDDGNMAEFTRMIANVGNVIGAVSSHKDWSSAARSSRPEEWRPGCHAWKPDARTALTGISPSAVSM